MWKRFLYTETEEATIINVVITVMIVDDEYEIRNGVRDFVDWAALGMEVVAVCEDGEDALSQSIVRAPDIVIIDIVMPGMDGLEAVGRMRSMGCASRVVFISSYSDIEYFKRAFKVSAVDYILKPVDMDELAAVLASQGDEIRAQRGEPPLRQGDGRRRSAASSAIIRAVCACIDENLGNRLTISLLAEKCFLSANYLSYLFRREMGVTVNDYITARRMRQACLLLRQGQRVYVGEIARQVGYQDPAYFTRQFKKSMGCTPLEYINNSAPQ
jgi:two-component system response regulator YesN